MTSDLSCSASVLADDPLASPTNVTVAGGLLTWTPVASQTDVTYTVQVSRYMWLLWWNVFLNSVV